MSVRVTDAKASLARVKAERDALREALERTDLIADVMLHNGPGANEAYRRPGAGIPTSFGHMRTHAGEIRRIIRTALAAAAETESA